jgi:hypothetical protein
MKKQEGRLVIDYPPFWIKAIYDDNENEEMLNLNHCQL